MRVYASATAEFLVVFSCRAFFGAPQKASTTRVLSPALSASADLAATVLPVAVCSIVYFFQSPPLALQPLRA